jgi:prevent-host-death family protein
VIEVNVHEAKTQLSKLLTSVAAGEEVMICRYGRPAAKLVPCRPASDRRQGGADRGLFEVPGDFDDELPELRRAFEG